MTCRSTTKAIVSVLIVALALLCLGDLVEAAFPPADGAPCASRLCDEQTGCGTPAAKPMAIPAATVVGRVVIASPMAITSPTHAVATLPLRDRQVAPLAPRSPPLA